MKFLRNLTCSLLLTGAGLTAIADDTMCTGVLSGRHDNVIVPAGVSCNIVMARIEGNVKVYGDLDVEGPARILGNIQGEPGHGYVRLHGFGVVVHGNVQLKGGALTSGFLSGTRIGEDFQYEENAGGLMADGGFIGGNLQMFKNTGSGSITDNRIRGNLQCKENEPAPVGGGNLVGGNKEDQCAGF